MVARSETSTCFFDARPPHDIRVPTGFRESRFFNQTLEQQRVPSAVSTLVAPLDLKSRSLTIAECNERLQQWSEYRGKTDEDGLVWPSNIALDTAWSFLRNLSRSQLPLLMAPDGDGGVSLEWRNRISSERIQIDEEGAVILRRFRDSRLIDTQKI